MEVKITKKVLLDSVRGSVVNMDTYLIHGRIINDEKTAFYRFKFVLPIDLCDDLWDEEFEEEIPYNTALSGMIDAFCNLIPSDFNDRRNLKLFIDDCNATIERYNRRFARC